MHPYNLGLGRKWLAVTTVSMGSLCVACISSIYSMTYNQLLEEFNCSHEIATLGLSLFIWGMGVEPLILAPLSSKVYGRRIIYLWSLTFFFIWLLPCAVAKNIQTLLVAQFLDGFAGRAFLSVAGGTVGDLFPRHRLAFPMMVYTARGFINQHTHWQWTFYMLLCWTAVMILLVYLFVPETYQVVLEPMCLCFCIYSALLLGILYLFFGAFQIVFQSVYGFELWQCGLSFLGLLIGMIFAILSDHYWASKLPSTGNESSAIAGAPLVTISLFVFAWSTYSSVHWIVPITGCDIFGVG
ncbi:major facilitator superfamily domain-containing protein [Aspergillus sergii]|uniref:Major facilitator superfamily domain-containing protein n=1 Tax=Aspergillus sergii TaxID=1034303 RepID=A0A5N6X238_9EURO|nr:major facilitator superfamily domain-containing protein [Aspergillus sergii]